MSDWTALAGMRRVLFSGRIMRHIFRQCLSEPSSITKESTHNSTRLIVYRASQRIVSFFRVKITRSFQPLNLRSGDQSSLYLQSCISNWNGWMLYCVTWPEGIPSWLYFACSLWKFSWSFCLFNFGFSASKYTNKNWPISLWHLTATQLKCTHAH